MHYAGVWGCSRPTALASMKGSMTASMRKLGRTHRQVFTLSVTAVLDQPAFFPRGPIWAARL